MIPIHTLNPFQGIESNQSINSQIEGEHHKRQKLFLRDLCFIFGFCRFLFSPPVPAQFPPDTTGCIPSRIGDANLDNTINEIDVMQATDHVKGKITLTGTAYCNVAAVYSPYDRLDEKDVLSFMTER